MTELIIISSLHLGVPVNINTIDVSVHLCQHCTYFSYNPEFPSQGIDTLQDSQQLFCIYLHGAIVIFRNKIKKSNMSDQPRFVFCFENRLIYKGREGRGREIKGYNNSLSQHELITGTVEPLSYI